MKIELRYELGRSDPSWYVGAFDSPGEVIGRSCRARLVVFGEAEVRVGKDGERRPLFEVASCDEDIARLESSEDFEWVRNPWYEVHYVHGEWEDAWLDNPFFTIEDALVAAVEIVERIDETVEGGGL